MWIAEDGRLATAAVPLEEVLKINAVRSWMAGDTEALEEFDPWRPGGVADSIAEALDAEDDALTGPDEREFENQAVPDGVLAAFPWADVVDVKSAEVALWRAPLRWRLDIAHVIEDLIIAADDPLSS